MAVSDRLAFIPRNQPCELGVAFFDVLGVLITGWTGATFSCFVDGVAVAGGSISEHATNPGLGKIVLTAAQTNGYGIDIKASITNPNAGTFVAFLTTSDLRDNVGRAATLEGQLHQVWMSLANRFTEDGLNITLYAADGTTIVLRGDVSHGTLAVKGHMS